ncbi:MAG: cytochrome c maturation protein CcmE [Candidatus Reddybacter sp.]
MKAARKQRLLVVIFIVVIATLIVGLLTYALRENINLFYTPSQIAEEEAPRNTQIRVGGMVVVDSLQRASDSLDSSFLVTDGSATLLIHYSGILPDLFAEDEAAVATGALDDDGVFVAQQVLAKHDEEYTPPEVADAMQQAIDKKAKALQSSEAAY